MSFEIAPPTSLDEFPDKFVELFQAFGLSLEKTQAELPRYWQSNTTLSNTRREVAEVVSDTVVIDKVPHWREPLVSLAAQAISANKGRIFFDLLSYILPADELLRLPLATELVEGDHVGYWLLAGHLPRNDSERSAIIELLPTLESVRLQRRAFITLKGAAHADREKNSRLLLSMFDQLDPEFFNLENEGDQHKVSTFVSIPKAEV